MRTQNYFLAATIALLFLFSLAPLAQANDPFDPELGPRNPRSGAQQYLQSRQDISPQVQLDLLNFDTVAVSVLQQLATAPSREVRALVAGNANTPLAILDILSKDKESAVRQYVASNKAIPPALLERLTKDKNANVRWSAEHNPTKPKAMP